MKRLLLTVGVCLCALLAGTDVSQTQSDNCPPCYSDRAPMTSNTRAHQLTRDPTCNCETAGCPGCFSDNRQVIRIRFDTTPGVTWSNGVDANGQLIEPSIYHAVRCAMHGWNTTQGSNGETVPYFFTPPPPSL